MKSLKAEKSVAVLITVVFVASLIPIFLLAGYNHPCADDFSYGLRPHLAWIQTGSLWEVLAAAGNKVAERYLNWQGTYSSIFLMTIQPAVFGDKYYVITPYVMTGMLSLGTFCILGEILLGVLKTTKSRFLLIGCGLLTVSIQLMLSPVEGIYWFNGAVHYVFMYSCMLLMLASYLHYLRRRKKRYMVCACFLAVVVGGGNYVTALTAILCIGIVGSFLILYGKKIGKETLILLFFSIASFGVSALAPGNSLRQENFAKNSFMGAILNSFRDAVEFTIDHTGILYILFLIFLIPFIVRMVSDCRISFRFPLLTPLVSYCLISAMFAPTEYSLQIAYIGRTGNVVLLMIQLLGVLNEIYILGWIVGKMKKSRSGKKGKSEKKLLIFSVVVGMLALGTVLLTYRDKVNYTSIIAVLSLRSGEVKQYDTEIRERLALLENGEKEALTLKPLQTHPYLLYFDDITENAKDWRNFYMARFYQKKYVVLESSQEE